MTRGTGVLATIGSTAPFVGLFGTVWGIMNSFIGISRGADDQPRRRRARHRRGAAGDRARPGRGDPGGCHLQHVRPLRSPATAHCSAMRRRSVRAPGLAATSIGGAGRARLRVSQAAE